MPATMEPRSPPLGGGRLPLQHTFRGRYEEYHPYGTTSWHAEKSGIEVSRKRYRYTGKDKDEETGLYYHRARYYAPWLGRWTSSDPAGMVDGVNRYGYVRGRPTALVDSDGRQSASPTLRQRGSVAASAIFDYWGGRAAAVGEAVQALPPVAAVEAALEGGVEAGLHAGFEAEKALIGGALSGAGQVLEALPPVVAVQAARGGGIEAGLRAGIKAEGALVSNVVEPVGSALTFGVRTVQNVGFLVSGTEALAKEAVESQVEGAVDVVETVGTALGTAKAARAFLPQASKAGITGYRAVEAGELADIEASGGFHTGPAGELGKGFFTTETAASKFARQMSKTGHGPFTTVTTEIPADVAARSARYAPAGEGQALFIMEEDLSLLGSPAVQNAMAVPR